MNARRLCLAFATVIALSVSVRAAESDLPRQQPGDAADSSGLLFPKDIGDVLPGKELPTFNKLGADPAVDVDRAKADLDRAQRKEQRWQKLVKAGVIAKVEAEAATLAA